MAGALMVVAGLLQLGRYTRFVPHSVMIGFLSGVAANIVFGQLPDFFGAEASGPYPLAKAWDLLTHPSRIDPATTACGVTALVLLLVLARTKLGVYAALIALVVPSVVVGMWVPATSSSSAMSVRSRRGCRRRRCRTSPT